MNDPKIIEKLDEIKQELPRITDELKFIFFGTYYSTDRDRNFASVWETPRLVGGVVLTKRK